MDLGLPWRLSGKESACQCKRCGSDPWVGKIPLRRKLGLSHSSISCLENPLDRGAWQATVHVVTRELHYYTITIGLTWIQSVKKNYKVCLGIITLKKNPTKFYVFQNLHFGDQYVLLAAAAAKSLQSCPTLRPHRQQPTRLCRPWDSPGKNTGVGCHFLLQCMKVKSESEVVSNS